MKPIKVKAVVVFETSKAPQLVSVHISRNSMWSARMHVKALMRKHPENEYFRLAVFAFIARGNELADKLRITTNPLELEFNRALKAQSNTPQHPVKLYGTLP